MSNVIDRIIEPKKQIPAEQKRFSNQDLKRLIVPIIVEQFLALLVGMADTLMISHAGEAAVSGAFAAMVMLYLALNQKNTIFIAGRQVFGWNKEMVGRIFRVAVPNGIEIGLFQLSKVALSSIITYFGTVQIAVQPER